MKLHQRKDYRNYNITVLVLSYSPGSYHIVRGSYYIVRKISKANSIQVLVSCTFCGTKHVL